MPRKETFRSNPDPNLNTNTNPPLLCRAEGGVMLCRGGAGGQGKRSQREGLQAVDVIMGQADTAGIPEVRWVYASAKQHR